VTLFKRLLKSAPVRQALCRLGAGYIRLVHATGRWQFIRAEIPEQFWQQDRPFILCFWHGRLMMMPYCWDFSHPIHMMVSYHRDGQFIARTVRNFGIDTVVGSSSRGGAKALRDMIKLLADGTCVGLTPDGPRGPRMRASAGIVSLARLSGVPVVPAAYSISRGWNLKSWDRFLVGGLFGRGVFVWGEPVTVARDADTETQENARLTIENSLNALTREADTLAGRARVMPAEVNGGAS